MAILLLSYLAQVDHPTLHLIDGLLLLAVRSGSLDLASFGHVPGGVARAAAQALLMTGQDYAEFHAAFTASREPRWQGR